MIDFCGVFYYYFMTFVLLIQRWNCTFDINTLNIMGLLRTIAIILAIYFGLRLLMHWLAPKLFAYAAKKAEAQFREVYGMKQESNGRETDQAGNIIVDKKKQKRNKNSEKVGEYIEFEEIE